MLASPKAVRLGAIGTRRNAGALPRGERYLRLVEAIPVSSNARAHACNQIDSQDVLQAYFIKRDVFALAHPVRLNRAATATERFVWYPASHYGT
jgi:hypothetical protein